MNMGRIPRQREGVALILVVGMLALLMVMGVAFSIFMRTERLAAGNFRNDVKVRQLLNVALSRAIQSINSNMVGRMYPSWDAMQSSGTNYVSTPMTEEMLSYLPLGAFLAEGDNWDGASFVLTNHPPIIVTNGVMLNLDDLSFAVISNIQSLGVGRYTAVLGSLRGGTNVWYPGHAARALQPAWINLPTSVGEGRVGFVVVNCSGLLDANWAGGSEREGGGRPSELQVSGLPDRVDTNRLVYNRVDPYETVQELIAVGTNADQVISVFDSKPSSYVCYSGFVADANKVYIGGDLSSLLDPVKEAAIKTAFQRNFAGDPAYSNQFVSFDATEASYLYANLIDYVDNDLYPGNYGNTNPPIVTRTDGPYVEPVWMINEVSISNRVEFNLNMAQLPGLTNYIVNGTCTIRFEYIYPFIGSMAPTCKSVVQISPVSGPVLTSIATAYAKTNPTPIMRMGADSVGYGRSTPYPWVAMASNGAVISPSAIPPTADNVFLVGGTVLYNNVVVDSVTNPPLTMAVSMKIVPNGIISGIVSQYVGVCVTNLECRDPRLNYDMSQWGVPKNGVGTIGTTNTLTLDSWGKWSSIIPPTPTQRGRDGDTDMFVANKPLETAGELGYLFFGKTWETVRLMPQGPVHKAHPVLDYFTTSQPSNSVYKGKLNLNTQVRNSLRAALWDMPVDWRGGASQRISDADVESIVDSITTKSRTNEFDTLSELFVVPWTNLYPAASSSSLDREALVRNLSGLVELRQRYFIVLLYVEATKTLPDGTIGVVSGAKGVAEVWQDPNPKNGPNRTLVRLLKILDDP